MNQIKVLFCSLALLLGSSLSLHAGELLARADSQPLKLAAHCGRPFGDHGVFQQKMPVPVWGWSLPGAKVKVSFEKQTKTTTAGKDGSWRIVLDPMTADKLPSVHEAPAGHTLTIVTTLNGKEATVSLHDILVGEVWLCSGQSNMVSPFGFAVYPPGSNKTANYPGLRYLKKSWSVCTPDTVGKYSRAGFCFARAVQAKIKLPVGILFAATHGSMIQSWFYQPPRPKSEISKYQNYEPKIIPIAGYAMRGTIWYQGENNAKDGRKYLDEMKRLVGGWRKLWGEGDFPFYFVQIASIGSSPKDHPAMGDGRAAIRNAQLQSLSIPNTGMAVTIDIGARHEHPKNKYDTGLRLARWALNRTYGYKNIVPSGPLYKSFKIEGSRIRVSFDYAKHGLMLAKKVGYQPPVPTPKAAMPWLSIKAKDGSWHWAQGKIDGQDLIVWSKDVTHPVAVRYAYTEYPIGCNLYNTDGLPASPFTTCGY